MLKKIVGWSVLLIFMSGMLSMGLGGFTSSSRDDYQKIDFKTARWTVSFASEHQRAIVHGDAWARDPTAVALRLAGYPNKDNILPEKINFERVLEDTVFVTVRTHILKDKLIRQKEFRVELVQSPELGAWVIVWAGIKQQCARNSFGFIWTTTTCS